MTTRGFSVNLEGLALKLACRSCGTNLAKILHEAGSGRQGDRAAEKAYELDPLSPVVGAGKCAGFLDTLMQFWGIGLRQKR